MDITADLIDSAVQVVADLRTLSEEHRGLNADKEKLLPSLVKNVSDLRKRGIMIEEDLAAASRQLEKMVTYAESLLASPEEAGEWAPHVARASRKGRFPQAAEITEKSVLTGDFWGCGGGSGTAGGRVSLDRAPCSPANACAACVLP